jgi:hypothetical protein
MFQDSQSIDYTNLLRSTLRHVQEPDHERPLAVGAILGAFELKKVTGTDWFLRDLLTVAKVRLVSSRSNCSGRSRLCCLF